MSEKQRLATLSDPDAKIEALATLWTIKECYTKYIGEGILFGMERIAVTLAEDGPEPQSVRVDGQDFSELGLTLRTGWLEDRGCRWAAISARDGSETVRNDSTLNHVDWEAFVKVFDTMH